MHQIPTGPSWILTTIIYHHQNRKLVQLCRTRNLKSSLIKFSLTTQKKLIDCGFRLYNTNARDTFTNYSAQQILTHKGQRTHRPLLWAEADNKVDSCLWISQYSWSHRGKLSSKITSEIKDKSRKSHQSNVGQKLSKIWKQVMCKCNDSDYWKSFKCSCTFTGSLHDMIQTSHWVVDLTVKAVITCL